jgi:glutathione S-transferase
MKPLVLVGDALWISPYVFTVFVALREKGLPFEVEELALQDGATRAPGYGDRTITGRVPALEHDGFSLAESSAIVEYLEDVFPPPAHAALLPVAPRERARARQLLSWLRSDDTAALRRERPTSTMFYERATAPLSESAQAAADKLVRVSERLLQGRRQLFGAFTLADADLAFMLHRLLLNGDAVPDGVAGFARAQWERPSVNAFVARPRPPFVPYA